MKNKLLYIYVNVFLIVCFVVCCLHDAKAQSVEESPWGAGFEEQTLSDAQYSRLVVVVDSLIYKYGHLKDYYHEGYLNGAEDKIFNATLFDEADRSSFEEYYALRIKKLRNDFGLRLSGYYNYNFKPGFSDEEDVYYKQRAYLGIDWNILNNGLFENRQQAQLMKLELEKNRLDYNRERARQNYIYNYNFIMYLFNREKVAYMKQCLALLKGEERIATELFYLRKTGWDKVLKIKEQIARLESFSKSAMVYNSLHDEYINGFDQVELKLDSLPYLDIDPIKMMAIYRSVAIDTSLTELQLKVVAEKYKSLLDWSVRPFIRYNMQQGVDDNNRFYGAVGMTAGIPLRFGPANNKLALAEQNVVKEESIEGIEQREMDLLNYFYDHQYKKYQLLSQYFKKAQYDERIRKQEALRALNSLRYSPLTELKAIQEKLLVEIELVDLKKQLYLNVLKIQSILNGSDVSDFTSAIVLKDYVKRYAGDRSLYVWSKKFDRTSNQALLADFSFNEIETVLLSIGQQPDSEKIRDFLRLTNANQINVAGMIGNNILFDYDDQELAIRLNQVKNAGFEEIHLDVEPHTLADWDSKKEEYLSKLVNLFRRTREFADANTMRFSASIPVFYPQNHLREIYSFCDKVYLMAYETSDVDKIVRRVKEEIAQDETKSVIAVRPVDFSSRIEMEGTLEQLMLKLPVRQFALHHLGDLHQLEKTLWNQTGFLQENKWATKREGKNVASPITKEKVTNNTVQTAENALVQPRELETSEPIELNQKSSGESAYYIQVAARKTYFAPKVVAKNLEIEDEVLVFFKNGYYKYVIQEYKNVQDGMSALASVRKMDGLEGAFVVQLLKSDQIIN